MKIKRRLSTIIFTTLFAALLSNNANSALYSRLNGQAVYDDVANLTWLSDANSAIGSGFDSVFSDGRMNYQQAVDWTNNLNIAGVTGWRLPTTQQPDYSCDRRSNSGNYYFGSNCRSSEMGNLFYNVLGGTPSSSIIANHNINFDFFSNIQEAFYWSSTDQPGFEQNSIGFYFNSGYQRDNNKAMPNYAWAVRSGDVSAVPIPASIWLFLSGIMGLIGLARSRIKAPSC